MSAPRRPCPMAGSPRSWLRSPPPVTRRLRSSPSPRPSETKVLSVEDGSHRTGLAVSGAMHLTLLAVLVFGFARAPRFDDAPESIPVETITSTQLNEIMEGEKTAKPAPTPPKPAPPKPAPQKPPPPPEPPKPEPP